MTNDDLTLDDDKFDIKSITVEMVLNNFKLKKYIEKVFESEGYELIMPPEQPKINDEYLGNGKDWCVVQCNTYEVTPYCNRSYIARRISEHKKMYWFFFGKPNKK